MNNAAMTKDAIPHLESGLGEQFQALTQREILKYAAKMAAIRNRTSAPWKACFTAVFPV